MKHIILAANECGKSDRVVAKLFKVNPSTVCRIYNRLECVSRYSIGSIVKSYGTIVAAKCKTIFEDNVLPFAEDRITSR